MCYPELAALVSFKIRELRNNNVVCVDGFVVDLEGLCRARIFIDT